MTSRAHSSTSPRRGGFELSSADGDQPAGRILALLLADEVGTILAFSLDPTRDLRGRAGELHRYRLALRRAKTVLIAGRSVFPPEMSGAALTAVSLALGATAEARNLDILVDSLEEWSEQVGPALQKGLGKVSAAAAGRQDSAYREVLAQLESPGHMGMLDQLRTLSTVYRIGGEEPGSDALISSRRVARAAFASAWSDAEDAGKGALSSNDPEDWHRLRRRLKRVGHLLDAFGPILIDAPAHHSAETAKIQAEIVAKVSKQVRKLLRDLGELQDLIIEADLLLEIGSGLGVKAAMATGAVVNPIQVQIPRQIRRCRRRWKKLSQVGGR